MMMSKTEMQGRKKKHLLFLGSQMAIGGAQKVLLEQANWFTAQGYSVTAAFLYDKQDLHSTWSHKYPFPIINLGFGPSRAPNLKRLSPIIKGLWRLWRLLRQYRFQAIETFTIHSNLIGMLLARTVGIPVRIATHHGWSINTPLWQKELEIRGVNLGFAQQMVAISHNIQHQAIQLGISSSRISVIYNGLQLPEPDPNARLKLCNELEISRTTHLILTTGRLTPEKGIGYLLQAAITVLNKYPDTLFLICGDGILRNELEQQSDKIGINNHVRFLGYRHDAINLAQAVDIYVQPSLMEGLGLSLMEAMGMGCAAIATRVGGMPEVIHDGINGLLVAPADSQALSSAIIYFLDNPTYRHTLADAAAAHIHQEYTLAKMCQAYQYLLDPDSYTNIENGGKCDQIIREPE
jgi:glycosyltransferase involved in cell wall biosynthesis